MSSMCAVLRRTVVGLAVVFAMSLAAASAVPAAAQAKDHCGQIASNETWSLASSPHIVRCDVTVRNSTLTIQPGVRVLMSEGTSLVIGPGSSLQAVGGENGYIWFSSNSVEDTRGFWSQVLFQPGANESRLDYVNMMSGGRDGVPMVEARGAVARLNHMNFRLTGGVPAAFTANDLGPSLEQPGAVTVGRCDLFSFTGVADMYFEVLADADVDVVDSQTWYGFCIPYRVTDTITVAGPDSPSLRLGPGVELMFSGDAGLVVGLDETNTGGFEADGTTDEPVYLTSQNRQPGSWGSVKLSPYSVGSSMIDTIIEYGGRGGVPMLTVQADDTIAIELRMRHAERYPLAILPSSVGSFVTALAASENEVFVENGVQRILVLANESEADITFSTEWTDVGVDYEIDGDLTVAGELNTAELTLSAGIRPKPDLRIAFGEGEGLIIGDPVLGRGSLKVVGTVTGTLTKPVVLTSESGEPGSWDGIKITDYADRATFDQAVIEDGGGNGAPMVDWGDVAGSVSRTAFRGAAGYPLAIPLSRAEAVMGEDQNRGSVRNRFEGNGIDRILVRNDGPLTKSIISWANPGAPVEFTEIVVVASPQTPVIDLYDGLVLLFRPGVQFQVGVNDRSRGAVRVVNQDPDFPVTFDAAEGEAGWGGIVVGPGSTVTGEDLHLRGAAADAVNIAAAGGTVVVADLTLEGSARGTGLLVSGAGARAKVSGGRIANYDVGVHATDRGWLDLSRVVLSGNSAWGVLNDDATQCVRARLVFWGTAAGPQDESDAKDGCMNSAWTSPQGQRVSDDVEWWPYATDTRFTPSVGLGPNARYLYLPLTRNGAG